MPKHKTKSKVEKIVIQEKIVKKKASKKNVHKSLRSRNFVNGLDAYCQRYFTSLLNPWAVTGAKVPDSITQPSSTWQCISRFKLVLDSNGDALFTFGPQTPAYAYYTTTATPQTSFQAPATAAPNYSAAGSLYSYIRTVSAGVKMIPIVSSSSDAGIVVSGLWPRALGLPTIASFQNTMWTTTSKYSEGATVLWRPLDIVDDQYALMAGTATTYILISVQGGTAGSYCEFDMIVNYECVVAPTYRGLIASAKSPFSPMCQQKIYAHLDPMPTSFSNSAYVSMLNHEGINKSDVSGFADVFMGGASTTTELAAQMAQRLNDQLHVNQVLGSDRHFTRASVSEAKNGLPPVINPNFRMPPLSDNGHYSFVKHDGLDMWITADGQYTSNPKDPNIVNYNGDDLNGFPGGQDAYISWISNPNNSGKEPHFVIIEEKKSENFNVINKTPLITMKTRS